MDMFTDTVELANGRLRALAASFEFIELGKAAEHLVCADLILQGYCAYLSAQGLSYDVVVDMGGRLVRVQVKSTCFAKPNGGRLVYWFKTRRKDGDGSHRRFRNLTKDDCDIVALVALDIRVAAYFPVSRAGGGSVKLRAPGDTVRAGKGKKPLAPIDCYPFSSAVGHA